METIEIRIDSHPEHRELSDLWRATWETEGVSDFRSVLSRGLAHVSAYHQSRIVGFANLAWDGGHHGFLVDVCVHPDYRDHGIGQAIVETIIDLARKRGLKCIHVDFEPYLRDFYLSCGFKPVEAALLKLA